jgi:hypothetical protein
MTVGDEGIVPPRDSNCVVWCGFLVAMRPYFVCCLRFCHSVPRPVPTHAKYVLELYCSKLCLQLRYLVNRDVGRKSWGDEGYSREELVAELGSAFLCADLELHQEPREENAAYIATWLEVLKNDHRAIFAAAAQAQRAADYLNQKAAAQVPETCAA